MITLGFRCAPKFNSINPFLLWLFQNYIPQVIWVYHRRSFVKNMIFFRLRKKAQSSILTSITLQNSDFRLMNFTLVRFYWIRSSFLRQWSRSKLVSIIIISMLLENEVAEYQNIHKQIYAVDISKECAQELGIKLIVLLETITRPKNIIN